MYILIHFIVPIMFNALKTELTCFFQRTKENGGGRLVLTSEAFMPKYAEYAEFDGTKGEEPIFYPFIEKYHTIAFQALTMSGASPIFRPNLNDNGVFGVTSMFSSYLDYTCDDIEDLELRQEEYEDEVWYQNIADYMMDVKDERECLSFMMDPYYDECVAVTEGATILEGSAVFNVEKLLNGSDDYPTTHSIEEIGRTIFEFVKAILSGETIDIPDFEITPVKGGKAIIEFHKGHAPIAHPLGDITDEANIDAIAEEKIDIAFSDTMNKPNIVFAIDDNDLEEIPELVKTYTKQLLK